MGVIPTIAPYLLPKVLPGVKEQFPSLKLYLLEDQTLRLIRQLEEGRLDVLLLALPVDAPGTVTRELFKEHFVVALPEGHPLAEQNTVRKEDLEKHTLLLLEDGHCLRDQALEVCKQGQATGDDIIKATSLSTLVEMVAGGLGITLVPELAAPVEDAAHKRLALRPFSDPQPWRSVGLVWREQSGNQKELRMLGDFLQDLTTGLLKKSRSAHLKTMRPN
jgi:LysR family hydrogen peroxide-inducible transcriptional activator